MRKLFEWLADLFTTKIGPNKTVHTNQIKEWLNTDQQRKWSNNREEPNYFFSDDDKAIYIYDGFIEYWENTKVQEEWIQSFPIPSTRAELYLMF